MVAKVLICGDYDVLRVFLACCYMVASVFWMIGRVFVSKVLSAVLKVLYVNF